MKGKKHNKLYKLIRKKQNLLVSQCVFGLLEYVMTIFLIYQISNITDLVSNNDSSGFIKVLPISLLAIVVQIISFYIKKHSSIKFKAYFSNDIRYIIGRNIIHTSLELKEKLQSARIISILNNQVELLQNFLDNITCIIINPIIIIIASIYFARISIKLLVISCVFIPVSSAIYNRLSKPIQKKTKDIMNEKASLNVLTKDVFSGFYIMKVFGLQHYFSKKHSNKVNVIALKEKEKDKVNSILGRIFIILRYIPQLIIPLYGGYLSFINDITVGQLIAANSIIWYILLPIEELLDFKKKAHTAKPALDDIYQLIELKQEVTTEDAFENKKSCANKLDIQNLTFAYEEGVNVLNNVNLEINSNEHITIIGESGAGKSTLLKIICGLYTEFKGKITVNGKQLSSKNAVEIRKIISYVPQHPYLFQDTIENNISMGRSASREYIETVAKLADADGFIKDLPEGYDTVVGSGGVKLSGGQCKRIAIARALIKDGGLFVLDEPTSALDLESEKRVSQGLYKACQEKCFIKVTHSLEFVEQKDKVVILREGCLYER